MRGRIRSSLFAAAARAAALALAGLASPSAGWAQEDAPVPALEGVYEGLGSARGMRIEITDAGRTPEGRFVDSNGIETEIGGGWKQGGLEALLNFPGRPVYARLTPAAMGLQMAVLPLDPEGRPLRDQARILAFLREGVETPAQPELYMDAPARAGQEIDPDVFLASYQFWTPEGVARGFDNIGQRYRTMIRLFPQLHADVLWKLCGTGEQRQRLAEALRGQGADCAEIERTVARLQEAGRFGEWKRAVAREIEALMPAVQCARGYIVTASVCEPAARRVSEAAASLETVGGVLARWR